MCKTKSNTPIEERFQIYAGKIFKHPHAIISAYDNKTFLKAFDEIEKYSQTHFLIGYISYAAKDIFLNKAIQSKTPLLYFEVFTQYAEYQPKTIHKDIFLFPKSLISYSQYKAAFQKIKQHIACGNTYEVNYTYACDVAYAGDILSLYEKLLPLQTTPYNAFIQNDYEEILSFSPELFFIKKGNRILTKPMKGTLPRKSIQSEDEKQIDILKNDIKNRAENVMIVDLLRNDLNKIAVTGSVKVTKLFEVETHKTLHQMTSEIEAELPPGTTHFDSMKAIFPCGSITGAPKIKTMEIIDELETTPRNIYCGAIGYISPEESIFSVPIRILQRNKTHQHFRYHTGGAIVWDSKCRDEWEETLIKTRFISVQNPDFGLIETIKVENMNLVFGNEHLCRLKQSANKLGFIFNPELKKLQAKQNGILRISLSKNGTYEVSYRPMEAHLSTHISISPISVNSKHPLVNHKTSYRPQFENSMLKIKNGELFDELFLNEKGELTEGARSNIILEIGNQCFTPKLESGLLNGIYRQKLLREKKCIEKILYVSDIEKANNIYCINSVRGITKVTLIT